MKLRFLLPALVLLIAGGCSRQEQTYVAWLKESMPLPDSLQYPGPFWKGNVHKTLEVRKKMGWGVPEREFRHFVLPLRVNNEALDDFRTLYADTLCRRVKGMGMAEAALEINHWCHEQATYQPSDSRTSSPVQTIRRGVGRCGEESVLTVAALRAAGIPARQVYTPRWAHTDDNHAWVEVWTGDGWHFMGACEPAPTVDNAWFNGAVSRAMLLHTKVFGRYDGPEQVISRNACYTEINVTAQYVPTRRIYAVVTQDGTPVQGAAVSFRLYNYAELYPVASFISDGAGAAYLDTGLGDIVVWASKDSRFGYTVSRGSGEVSGAPRCDTVVVELSHSLGERFVEALDLAVPAENPIPTNSNAQMDAANAFRLAEEDAIRASHPHDNPAVEKFLHSGIGLSGELLNALTAKDLGDVSYEVLEDAARYATGADKYLLSPRVADEPLRPFRGLVAEERFSAESPQALIEWIQDSITVVEGRNPQGLCTAPEASWRERKTDEKGRNILFVALCRALGWPARIDEVTGRTQYFSDGVWKEAQMAVAEAQEGSKQAAVRSGCDVAEQEGLVAGTGELRLVPESRPGRSPEYYSAFTLSAVGDDGNRLMEYEEGVPTGYDFELPEGYYVLCSGRRLASGGILAKLEFMNVDAAGLTTVPLVVRDAGDAPCVIGSMDAEKLFLKEGENQGRSLLSATGRGYFLLVVTGDGDEPSVHASNDLDAISEVVNEWGRPVVVLGETRPAKLSNAIFGKDIDGSVARMLLEGCGLSGGGLPVVALCDSFGRIIFISRGYNTSFAGRLTDMISKDL